MTDADLPEPPEGFLSYPEGNVIALMTDATSVSGALDDLTNAGFARDKMYVLVGPTGAERLDVTGQRVGLSSTCRRFADRLLVVAEVVPVGDA